MGVGLQCREGQRGQGNMGGEFLYVQDPAGGLGGWEVWVGWAEGGDAMQGKQERVG